MSDYTWGADGYGRAHICKRQSNIVLFCMLGEVCGMTGVWILEEQDRDDMFGAPDWDI